MTMTVRFGTYFAFSAMTPELTQIATRSRPSMSSTFHRSDGTDLFEIVSGDNPKVARALSSAAEQHGIQFWQGDLEPFEASMVRVPHYRAAVEDAPAFFALPK